MSNPTILEVLPGSPAASAGLRPGDELLAVNGVAPTDVIEYQQLVDDADPLLMVLQSGAQRGVLASGSHELFELGLAGAGRHEVQGSSYASSSRATISRKRRVPRLLAA